MTARKARNEVSDSILLAIEPRFAEKILNGEKRYEFRTIAPKADVKTVYLYASAPVKRIVGKFDVQTIYRGRSPDELWRVTRDAAGIDYAEYHTYSAGRNVKAYVIANPVRFPEPIDPKDIRRGNPYFTHYRQFLFGETWRAPQNFVYLSAEKVMAILEAEEKLKTAKLGDEECP